VRRARTRAGQTEPQAVEVAQEEVRAVRGRS
jgi:hypothetical protein